MNPTSSICKEVKLDGRYGFYNKIFLFLYIFGFWPYKCTFSTTAIAHIIHYNVLIGVEFSLKNQ